MDIWFMMYILALCVDSAYFGRICSSVVLIQSVLQGLRVPQSLSYPRTRRTAFCRLHISKGC